MIAGLGAGVWDWLSMILLVEQNTRMALLVANRGYILQTGEVVFYDSAEALRANGAQGLSGYPVDCGFRITRSPVEVIHNTYLRFAQAQVPEIQNPKSEGR
jgi:hypothetical protein